MKIKTILLLAILFLLSESAMAQKSFAIGFDLGYGKGRLKDVTDSFGVPRNQNRGIQYYALALVYKKNLTEFSSGSLGLCIPVSIGYGDGLFYSGAAIVQYQSGALSSEDNADRTGYYAGAGVGLTHGTWVPVVSGTNELSTLSVNSITPTIEFGYRTRTGRAEYFSDWSVYAKLNSNPDAKHEIFGFKVVYYLF